MLNDSQKLTWWGIFTLVNRYEKIASEKLTNVFQNCQIRRKEGDFSKNLRLGWWWPPLPAKNRSSWEPNHFSWESVIEIEVSGGVYWDDSGGGDGGPAPSPVCPGWCWLLFQLGVISQTGKWHRKCILQEWSQLKVRRWYITAAHSRQDLFRIFTKFLVLLCVTIFSENHNSSYIQNDWSLGFLGGPVVKNPSCNARDTVLTPGPGRSHMLQSNRAWAPQLLTQCSRALQPQWLSPCAATTEAWEPRACAPQKEKPPQWEAHTLQWKVAPAFFH